MQELKIIGPFNSLLVTFYLSAFFTLRNISDVFFATTMRETTAVRRGSFVIGFLWKSRRSVWSSLGGPDLRTLMAANAAMSRRLVTTDYKD